MTRVASDPDAQLMSLRCGNLESVTAHLTAGGRVPRVYLYAAVGGEHEPRHAFPLARAFAEERGWTVVADGTIKDFYDWTSPRTRLGWAEVRRAVAQSAADGVVVLSRSVISPHRDEYEEQLDWFHDNGAFVALVTPEVEAAEVAP